MGSVTLSCACINGFCLFLCFCWQQLILLSAHLGNWLLVSYSHAPSWWVYCMLYFSLHHWSVSSWCPPAYQLGFWAIWGTATGEMVRQSKGMLVSQALQLAHQSPWRTMWKGAVSWAGKGIPIEANQPAIALWQLTGQQHETDILLWKITQTKIPCSYFPMTQPEKGETQQSVSLTVGRVFSGRVCELWALCLGNTDLFFLF